MPATAWKSFGAVEPARQYTIVLSFLPLHSFWSIPRFLRHARRIAAQLSQAGGLVGYSLLAKPLARKFYTLSVWEDEAALNEFVRASPHATAMTELRPHMGQTRSVTQTIGGRDIPPSWDSAFRL